MTVWDMNNLVAEYIRQRDNIATIEDRHKEELRPFKEVQEILTVKLLEILDHTGQESARTKSGTVTKGVHTTASCAEDPDGFIQFVRKNDLWELVNRAANKDACMQYLDQHGVLPPGVKLNHRRTVSVKVPTKTKSKSKTNSDQLLKLVSNNG